MNQHLRAGLIGCGSLSQRGVLPHLSVADARDRVRLVAVVDAVEERARESARRFDIPASFTSVEAMLAEVDLDLVLVISPIAAHFAHAMAAIEAGKHVYIQKAMTTSLAEAGALLAARDRMNVKLAAAPGYELFPTTQLMRQIVDDRQLGHVAVAYTYTMGFGHEYEPIRAGAGVLEAIDPSWYYRAGAGPLPDVTVYALQLATSVLGPVRRVAALSNTLRPQRIWKDQTITVETPDNNLVMIEFASGTLGVAVGSDCRGSGLIPWGGLGLYGTAGALEVTYVDHNSGYPLRFNALSSQHSAELADQLYLKGEHLAIEEPHVYADIMDLVDAIRDDRAPQASGEQARHVVEIIERARVAARTGQTQELRSTFAPASSSAS
ncbi:MAG TPA: Gfo/Idh/MocA family oxidoreductase [Roseiflexaceae bacterium]|nr:Gfo/Idh/MocA family oxidoreductase [Roseiflexaceae bacterium]